MFRRFSYCVLTAFPLFPLPSLDRRTVVVIHNSELLAGSVDKKLLGGGSKSSIFYSLLRDYGSEVCADAMWRLGRIALFYLAHRGFSIGIGEVMPSDRLVRSKTELIKSG